MPRGGLRVFSMFERYESVLERVGVVTRRYRQVRFWWAIGSLAAISSIVGWCLLGPVRSGAIPGDQVAIGLLIATAVAAGVALILVRFSYRNPRWVAARIESRFPGLQQRLLTALSQTPSASGNELSFLQRRVITDAYQHSKTHHWSEAVPGSAALLSRLTGGLSLAMLALVTWLLVQSPSPNQLSGSRIPVLDSPSIIIEPGDAEVEKGSGLVISARFAATSDLPDSLDLIALNNESNDALNNELNSESSGEPHSELTSQDEPKDQRIAMSQSLDDPILSAYVPMIEKSFRYQVVSRNWQSKPYSVDVFEFPNLVRADAVLDYPDYTQLETKQVDDTVRVSVVEGTKLTWTLFFNKPLADVTVRNTANDSVELSSVLGEPSQRRFELTLLNTTRWTIELTDDKGRKNKYPITLDARVIPNRIPELKVTGGGDRIASPLEELSIAATVKDDFGLVAAGVAFTFAGGATEEVTLKENIERNTKQPIDHLLELEQLKAEPDQLLSYHFWADDYSPTGEIRRTQGDLFFVEIRPFEEIYREGETPPGGKPQQSPPPGASQQTEQLAELQKQIIAATWKIARDPKPAKEVETFHPDVIVLKDSQQQAIDQATELAEAANDAKLKELIEKLTGQMGQAVEHLTEASEMNSKLPLSQALVAEQAAYQTLLKLRAHEFEVSRAQQKPGQKNSSASAQRRQQQLDQLELKNDENRYEMQSEATEENAQDAAGEDRQILNRLKELAQRQEDINKQLAQLQSALEQAKTEEEKDEVRRQLKRLREQEQEMIRAADELADQMQQSENNQELTQQAEQLEQTRENLRRASEALEKNAANEALAAGTRVERELDQMSEEFRKRAAGEFNDTVREMRAKARELEQAQQQLGQQLDQLTENIEPGLRSGGDRDAIQKSLKEQEKDLSELLTQVQQTVEQAEPSEPLLAQNLYETFRKAQQSQVEKRMSDTGELLRRGFDPQAQQLQDDAQRGTEELRRNLEKAAESVLGDETKALERALNELEKLDEALKSEMSTAQGEPGEPFESDSQQSSNGAMPEGQPSSEEKQGQGEPNSKGQPGEGKPGEGKQGRGGLLEQMGQAGGGDGGSIASPIAGGGFREWSDGLGNVEEMVGNPELRSEAAAIRDRARQMRVELRRTGSKPQWELVESMIAKPLRELKMKVSEELLRRSADRTTPVPIDRDPVPDEYSNAVKRYYESLGSGR